MKTLLLVILGVGLALWVHQRREAWRALYEDVLEEAGSALLQREGIE